MSTENINVSMTGYQWNRLLHVIEDGLSICNRNQSDAILLYEEIATQLNGGKPVKVIHSQNPDPAYRPDRRAEPTKEPKEDKGKTSRRMHWRFWA